MAKKTMLVGRGKRPQKIRERKDSWTRALRDQFLDHLAATCNVEAACATTGKSVSGLYTLRRRCAKFRAEWAAAVREAYAKLELDLLDRSMNGTVKTIDRGDGRVETIREYPNAVALHLLRMHRETAAQADAEYDPDEIEKVRERIARKLEIVRKRIDSGEEDGE